MAKVQADVKLGELLGQKFAEGYYIMEDGLIYSDADGEFESAEGEIEIPDAALANAEDAKNSLKLRKEDKSEEVDLDD
jgi:hypothetical protein